MAENEQVGPEADEAEMMQQLREELKSLTVSDHLLFMMHSLSALAVDRMGLTEEAGGRRDPDEARLAIDAFKALLELVGKARTPEEMAAQRSVLSQLQMSYVAVLGHAGAEEAPPGEAADESPEGPTESPEGPTETPTEALAEAPTETPTEALAEAPTDAPTDAPAEATADAPVEATADASAEAPTGEPEGRD